MERDATFARVVDVTAGRLALSELLRNIARASGENSSVRRVGTVPGSCNFSRVRVFDLVRFLCRVCRLDVASAGDFPSVFPAAAARSVHPIPSYTKTPTRRSPVTGWGTAGRRGEKIGDVGPLQHRRSSAVAGRKGSGRVCAVPFDGALRTLASVDGFTPKRTFRALAARS